MNDTWNYIFNLNWQAIVGMFLIGWYFTHDIRETLVKLESDVREQGKRTDRLYEMFCDLQKQFIGLQKQLKDEILEMKKEMYDFMKEKK